MERETDQVTLMVPMFRKHKDMLAEIHAAARRRDPRIHEDRRVFLAMLVGNVIEQMHRQVCAPVIQQPTQQQAQAIVSGRGPWKGGDPLAQLAGRAS